MEIHTTQYRLLQNVKEVKERGRIYILSHPIQNNNRVKLKKNKLGYKYFLEILHMYPIIHAYYN